MLLTRSPLTTPQQAEKQSVRLACVKHAASVRPEPGSNSPNKKHPEKPNHPQPPNSSHKQPSNPNQKTTQNKKTGIKKDKHTIEFTNNTHTHRSGPCSGHPGEVFVRHVSGPFHVPAVRRNEEYFKRVPRLRSNRWRVSVATSPDQARFALLERPSAPTGLPPTTPTTPTTRRRARPHDASPRAAARPRRRSTRGAPPPPRRRALRRQTPHHHAPPAPQIRPRSSWTGMSIVGRSRTAWRTARDTARGTRSSKTFGMM